MDVRILDRVTGDRVCFVVVAWMSDSDMTRGEFAGKCALFTVIFAGSMFGWGGFAWVVAQWAFGW